MGEFGELQFESSRAFADDEDEAEEGASFRLSVEWTAEGQGFKDKKMKEAGFVLCAFAGKVALGFGEGFLGSNPKKFTLLGQIVMEGNEGTVDLCSLRRRQTPIVRLLLGRGGGDTLVVFCLVNMYGVPRFLTSQLVSKVSDFLKNASNVVVFNSENAVQHGVDRDLVGKLFYLKSSTFPEKNLVQGAVKIPIPHIIGGPSAGILTECERFSRPCLLLLTFAENDELVDSISARPFLDSVKENKKVSSNSGVKGLDLYSLFSPFQFNIGKMTSVSNLYV